MIRFLTRLQFIDRRFLFMAMAVAILFPLLSPSGCPTQIAVDPKVQELYDTLMLFLLGAQWWFLRI